MRASFTWCVLLALFVMVASGARADTPNIAAASDLQLVLSDAARVFKSTTGRDVRLVMGSSGQFARQIQAGAPFELFLSADESFVELLAKAGRTEDAGVLYAIGVLALVVPLQSKIELDANLAGLGRSIAAGTVRRLSQSPTPNTRRMAARRARRFKRGGSGPRLSRAWYSANRYRRRPSS